MSDETADRPVAGPGVSPRAEQALAALLAIAGDDAARVRERSPARRRHPDPQYGPQLDLGDPEGS